MKKRNISVIAGLSLIALTFGFITTTTAVSAQSAPTGGQALEIAPPVIVLTADPGEVINSTITLRDVSNGNLVVTNQINDFVAGGEDGTPKLILDDSVTSPYSMKSWVTAIPEMTILARKIEKLPLKITVPANAAPGGYYSVVRFTGTPTATTGTGVSLSASLGTLILLKINGVAKEKLTIEEFSINKNGGKNWLFENTPLQFIERIKNDGNLHEQPTGQIAITDMFGNNTANVNINLEQNNILPQSIRKFNQVFDSAQLGDKILFGKYTAVLKLTYGASKQVITQTITFWVIPYTMIGIIILSLIAAFFALRFALKRYNKYIRDQVLNANQAAEKPALKPENTKKK